MGDGFGRLGLCVSTVPRATPTWAERNAIVLLSAGVDQPELDGPYTPTTDAMYRIEKSVADYVECKRTGQVCKVIVSGGDSGIQPKGHGIADAEIYAPRLEALGVKRDDMVFERICNTTYENAKYVEPLLHSGRYDTVVLVTSAYHMRRSMIAFERLGLSIIPDAADADRARFSVLPRRRNVWLALRDLHEIGGIIQLYLYDIAGIR
ncbi:hypothetical protein BHUM_01668 [Candidatus Burkholderia humilis]|nr:hypothetical protein BHUM_01668 [Candidatus Burkholderia humilis]